MKIHAWSHIITELFANLPESWLAVKLVKLQSFFHFRENTMHTAQSTRTWTEFRNWLIMSTDLSCPAHCVRQPLFPRKIFHRKIYWTAKETQIKFDWCLFWRWLFCLLEACVEKCKDCTRLYSLKDKCPKNILPEFRFDSLNGYHEWIVRRNVIELDLNKHLRFFCCSVYFDWGHRTK